MKYNKLVRDKITQIIKEDGSEFKAYKADDEEYWKKLKDKLEEEVQEFLEDENVEELADILEVVDTIIKVKNWSYENIKKKQAQKHEKRGGFSDKIILEEVKDTKTSK